MPILTPDERIGTEIAGKYKVRKVIAKGGMSVLFAGEHTWTRRPVAIKLLSPHASLDAHAVQRFLREARTTTALRHPHVVDVLDMGHADDGALYIVMELLEGADLSDLIAARGRLSGREAVAIVTPIVDALAAAHQLGFVHRDIKPGNVFLSKRADRHVVPKLLDFGIAKALDATEPGTSATRTGVILGTPHYMSPEQASSGDIGPASDTWAVGVLLFQMLAGVVPYDGSAPTMILMAILRGERKKLAELAPDAPPELVALVEKALAQAPAERPQDLRAWAHELRAAVCLEVLSTAEGPELIAGGVLDGVAHVSAAERTAPDAKTAVTPDKKRPAPVLAIAAAVASLATIALVVLVAVLFSSEGDASSQITATPLAVIPEAVPPPLPQATGDAGVAIAPLEIAAPPAEEGPTDDRGAIRRPARPRTATSVRPSGPTKRRPVAEIDTEW